MQTPKTSDIRRILGYTWELYTKKITYIVAFCIPMLFAWLILAAVQAPIYSAMGAPHLRTGSIPDLTPGDIFVIIAGYLGAMIIFAETIVNVNLLIKSKRMLTNPSSEILSGAGKYAFSISAFLVIMLLIVFIVQLITFEKPLQRWIYPLAIFVISYFVFFTLPAIVIDDEDLFSAVGRSIKMAAKKPGLIFTWLLISFALITIIGWVFLEAKILPQPLASYIYTGLHVIFISPFLLILQTHMYMEKYPLAK